MDTTTLDHTPYCAGGTLNTLLFRSQQTFQDATRQNKPVTSSTSRPTNVTTTANVLIVPCDKNLGPAIIERHDYLKIAMRDHLSDTTTYKSLTTSEIDRYSSDITKNILGWMKTHHKKLTKMERAFLRKKLKSNKSPYARFYLTLKAHKLKPGQTVDDLKSRPIVSCPGSLLHGLGIWVDRKLQEVVQRIVSYFKNTLELKKELLTLNLPRNARLFTALCQCIQTFRPTQR